MNNRERELWVLNDEGLYNWFRVWKIRNRGGMRGFLREHREAIDDLIRRAIQ